MGKSVKIIDLAKKMIQLSGLTIGKDIQITFTGLRPGEKLYEELLHNSENSLPTHHPQILIAKVKEYDYPTVAAYIDELTELATGQNEMNLVQKMKQIVPEFMSNNSVYEQLDNQLRADSTELIRNYFPSFTDSRVYVVYHNRPRWYFVPVANKALGKA